MTYCDNISRCHDPLIIGEDDNAMRVICKDCKQRVVIRKDSVKGVPENRSYIKFFKRHVLQGRDNLLYKYHPEYMSR